MMMWLSGIAAPPAHGFPRLGSIEDRSHLDTMSVGGVTEIGQTGDRGILEQINHYNIFFQAAADQTKHPDQSQRMAAKIKEIIADADVIDLQNFSPDRRNLTLNF